MTIDKLAELIVETCENLDYIGARPGEKVEAIKAYLDLLAPKNPALFANWGYPSQRELQKQS